MKYFLSAAQRKESGHTDFIEFQKGKFNNVCWAPSSIYLDEDVWDKNHLMDLIVKALPTFDIYGSNQIDKNQWERLIQFSLENSKWHEILQEAASWVETNFKEYSCFTIHGL